MEEVAKGVHVRSRVGVRLVEITFDARNAKIASDFVNSLLEEFIQVNLEERWRTSQRTTEWLTEQLHDLKAKLQASESKLQDYAKTWDLIFADDKDNVTGQRLRQIQEELMRARADVAARQARYELALSAAADSLPEVLDDAALKDYRIELTDLRRQLADLRSSMTSEHPKVIKMEAQQAELTAALERARANIVSRIRNEYEAARRRENLLAEDYAAQIRLITGQADKISHYNLLRREVDSSRQLYDSLFQRVKEAGIAAALPTSNIRIVDSARPPLSPYQPGFVINLIIGTFGGMAVGLGIALIRERSPKGFINPGDVSGYLSRFELGVIPSSSALRDKLNSARTAPIQAELSTWQQSDSDLAESFRLTLPSLIFPPTGAEDRIIVISSAMPGEGKSMICSNIAIAVAKAGWRVLLIDSDSRRPRIHEIFEVDNTPGLVDLLAGKTQKAHRETKIPHLSVLPAGNCTDLDLIFTPRLPHVLKALRAGFDTIIIDTPPVLHAPDARILARHADATILVVRANRTSRDAVRMAYEVLESDGISVLGTILNDWKGKPHLRYSYKKY